MNFLCRLLPPTAFLSMALLSSLAAEEKIDASGTWKWKFEMQNGDVVEPRVMLKQEGEKLSGAFVFSGDTEMEVKEGKINGDEISFKTFTERDGRKVTTSFAGKVSGEAIKGKVETDWSGEKKSYDWEPKREKGTKLAKVENGNASGNWTWSFDTPGGNTIQSIGKFKQEDGKLTGTVTGRNGMEMQIKEGKVEGDEVSFKVVRERDGRTFATTYNGKLQGDAIKGKLKGNFGGDERTMNWEAKRHKGDLKELLAASATGNWKWIFTSANGQSLESKAKLKQDGTKLTGTVTTRSGTEMEVQDGKVENGEVSFSTVRERDGSKIVTRYHGKVSENKIEGKFESEVGGTSRSRDWEAQKTGGN